jgi:Amt family ammonium transporter
MKFSSYVLFVLLWSFLVYDPVAHWVWGGGWMARMGTLVFAGGIVVHLTSGVAALALARMLGIRKGYPSEMFIPHNLTLTLLGAGLLWFGWFGFNAGSAVAVDHPVAGHVAGLAFATTQTAAAAGALTWLLIEWWHQRRPTSLGLASGILAGLVAITPAAGHVTPAAALVFGAVAASVCFLAVQAKPRFGYDDSLDAFGVHGVGGLVGALMTGLFCFIPVAGWFMGGGPGQFVKQAVGAGVAVVFAALGTLAIAALLRGTVGLRASDEEERDGLDISVHGERAYHQVISS